MSALTVSPAARVLAADTLRHAIVGDVPTARSLRSGMIAVGVLVVGLGGLAATVPIQGAVIAPGEVDVASHVKPISHPTGGIVAAVLAKDGDHVRRGQVLMRLDDRVSGAQAHYLGASVDQLLASEARLIAERDGAAAIAFPAGLLARADTAAGAAVVADARRSFAANRATLASQRQELSDQIAQSRAERAAATTRQATMGEQHALIGRELAMVRKLYEKRYTTIERLGALERSALDLKAGTATAAAGAIQAGAHIAELQARLGSLSEQARATAARELSEVQARLAESRRAKVSADDVVDRAVVRAPIAGTVDKSLITSVGSTVPAGEPLMQIVPDADGQVVRIRVPVDDIDQVAVGRPVRVRLNALDARTTPELDGVVAQVAANRTVDQRSGASYFAAVVRIADGQRGKLDGVALRPGMAAETYVSSSSRTLLQLLMRPLATQMRRAFRHD